jgi:hypothetical protein
MIVDKIRSLMRLQDENPEQFSCLFEQAREIANTDDPQFVLFAMIELNERVETTSRK